MFSVFIYVKWPSKVKFDDSNIQIIPIESDSGVSFFAKLDKCSEVTITLEGTYHKMKPSQPLPITVDSKGRKYFEIIRLSATGDNWDYKYHYSWLIGRRASVNSSNFVYSLPYKGGPFEVLQGYQGSFSHTKGSNDECAIDWKMPIGTEIHAARQGGVVALRMDSDRGGDDLAFNNAANYVVIKHDDGTFAEYMHLKKNSVCVALGQNVKQNELLGLSGNTGFSTESHLHFSVYCNIDGNHCRSYPVKFRTETGKIADGKAFQKP
jgi:murein DD-endopeptidase MepM/ murein hydrolase activator NlpD